MLGEPAGRMILDVILFSPRPAAPWRGVELLSA
jgi:hypothetical protein